MLFVMVGMGSTSAHSSPAAHSRDAPVLTWFAIWGFPAVAATSAVVHASLRMPVTAAMQSLYTLACTYLAATWRRTLVS
ncbi:hypothetical protein ABZ250_39600 [Streptomyces afghaniensis]|uniref:hypothetical protein n=1 Tax=Streptomyces afghaniensis TaxID=66865 RepID=UPI0033A5B0AB